MAIRKKNEKKFINSMRMRLRKVFKIFFQHIIMISKKIIQPEEFWEKTELQNFKEIQQNSKNLFFFHLSFKFLT